SLEKVDSVRDLIRSSVSRIVGSNTFDAIESSGIGQHFADSIAAPRPLTYFWTAVSCERESGVSFTFAAKIASGLMSIPADVFPFSAAPIRIDPQPQNGSSMLLPKPSLVIRYGE